jgi:RNA polymerase-interacting CarD/CdnL/TRCF family regulator
MATKKTTTAKKPAAKKTPAAKKPAAKKAVAKTSAAKKPAAKKTVAAKKPAAKKAVAKTSAAKKPAAKKTVAAKKPAAKKVVAKKPAAKKPAAKKTVAAKKPAAKKPAAKKTVAVKKPAAKKTVAVKKPAAKKTAAKKPATTKTSSATKAAADKPTGMIKPPSPRRRKASQFSVGDKVVHPHHGAAIITKKMKQVVAGEKRDYFVLEISTDTLTVFVPMDNIEDTIRPVISKAAAGRVFKLFKEEPQEAGSNWSRWYKVLTEKMTSGDIFQVAEVVRDLTFAQQTKGISPALKRMLSKARLTLTSELQFALGIDDEEATKKLDRALPKAETEES